MTKPGRIPCINPDCRCTESEAKYFGQRIVCRKCWKLVPKRQKDRYVSLKKLIKRHSKMRRKMREKGIVISSSFEHRAYHAFDANWAQIEAYFAKRPMPIGIENFLAEVGLTK